jgi:hypothetical protein
MAGVYGVVTVGLDARTRRASRTGDDFARAEVSSDDVTLRVEYVKKTDTFTIRWCPKRWTDAQAAPNEEWVLLDRFPGPKTVTKKKKELVR